VIKTFTFSIINIINVFILTGFTSVAELLELWARSSDASNIRVVPANWLINLCTSVNISFTGLAFVFLWDMTAFGSFSKGEAALKDDQNKQKRNYFIHFK